MATPPEAVETRNTTQILLIVLLAIVLLGALWFFVLRGDDAVDSAAPPVVPAVPDPTPEPETTTRPRERPVETFEVFAPKDPFKPAIASATTGIATAPTGTTDGTTDTTAGNGNGTQDGTGTGSGNGRGNGGASVGGHRVRLVDVFTQNGEQRARVQVDGTVYTVEEGDRFAENFELLSIEGQCASLLFGDDQFTLCEGEEILK